MMLRAIAILLATLLCSCGGGGDASPQPVAVQSAPQPVFTENWEPRTADNGVFGYVWDFPLVATPDGADPQVGWINAITGRWGTLGGLSQYLGLGPNRGWSVAGNRLHFHAEPDANSFALVSRQTFSRFSPISIEADFVIDASTDSGFAGLALIAGEGDYREISIRCNGVTCWIKRNTPLRETVLAIAPPGLNRLRLEYDPHDGFGWFLNGVRVGSEPIDHEGASFANNPSVALYFASSQLPAGSSFIEGSVGPVRVWADLAKEAQ